MLQWNARKKATALIGGVAVVASAVALGAGSLAYFSDTQSAPLANVATGTLTLSLNGGAVQTAVSVPNVEPGFTSTATTLTFQNTGTLAGQLRLRVVPAPGNSDEFNRDVSVTLTTPTDQSDAPTVLTTETLTAASTAGPVNANLLTAQDKQNISYTLSIDPNATNLLQNKTGSFSVVADLIQTGDGADMANPPVAFPAPAFIAPEIHLIGPNCVFGVVAYACTFTFPNTPAGVSVRVVYSSRPGFQMWTTDSTGTVTIGDVGNAGDTYTASIPGVTITDTHP